jgi:hypothetical protein
LRRLCPSTVDKNASFQSGETARICREGLTQLRPIDNFRVKRRKFPDYREFGTMPCVLLGDCTMTGWDRSPGPDNDYASAQPLDVWRGTLVMVLIFFAAGLIIGWLS